MNIKQHRISIKHVSTANCIETTNKPKENASTRSIFELNSWGNCIRVILQPNWLSCMLNFFESEMVCLIFISLKLW